MERRHSWTLADLSMSRELALKIVLAVVGLLFIALGYPMVVFIRQEPALSELLNN